MDGTESELEYYLANSGIYTDYTLALECGATLIADLAVTDFACCIREVDEDADGTLTELTGGLCSV